MLRPLRGSVLIRTDKKQEKQIGSLFVPISVADPAIIEGTVVVVGKGIITKSGQEIDPEVKEGDRVLFNKSQCTKIEMEEDIYIIRGFDIIGVCE